MTPEQLGWDDAGGLEQSLVRCNMDHVSENRFDPFPYCTVVVAGLNGGEGKSIVGVRSVTNDARWRGPRLAQ